MTDRVQLEVRQPDFVAMATHLNAFSTEIQHCANLPAIVEGNSILTALDTIQREVRGLSQRLEQRMDRLEERMDRFDQRMDRFEQSIEAE